MSEEVWRAPYRSSTFHLIVSFQAACGHQPKFSQYQGHGLGRAKWGFVPPKPTSRKCPKCLELAEKGGGA